MVPLQSYRPIFINDIYGVMKQYSQQISYELIMFEGYLKSIFHRKLCSRWLPNENEIDTNMKSTWPTQTQLFRTQVTLGIISSCWAIFWLALGIIGPRWGVALGPQEFLDTNMLVFPTQNSRVGGLDQYKGVCVVVEYRVNIFT